MKSNCTTRNHDSRMAIPHPMPRGTGFPSVLALHQKLGNAEYGTIPQQAEKLVFPLGKVFQNALLLLFLFLTQRANLIKKPFQIRLSAHSHMILISPFAGLFVP